MLKLFLLLTGPVSAVALLYARWEYRDRGKLSPLGTVLLCLMLLVPNIVLDYAMRYEMPSTFLDYLGVVIAAFGLALCVLAMVRFKSVAQVFCNDTGYLATAGPYRWGRNPQYVGWVLFLLGFSLNDWSYWCLAALLVVAVSLHLLVLIEEEHLVRVFGRPYTEYCRAVPRYFGLPANLR